MRVVLDTNVLVSALLKRESVPAHVLAACFTPHVELCASTAILHEYKAVLTSSKFQSVFGAEDVRKLLRLLARTVARHEPKELPTLADPNDAPFLACAVFSRAEFLITGNAKHFPAMYAGGKVVSPRVFLDEFEETLFS